MFISVGALALLVLSLAGIAIIVGRKFPLLARFDTSANVSPHTERKRTLIEERLRRKVGSLQGRLTTKLGPAGAWTKRQWEKTHHHLVNLEHEYKIRSLPVLLNRRQRRRLDDDIADLLTQARALLADDEVAAAEEKCMQAIRLEPRSVPAFELLGQLYMRSKEFGHAKEVYHYLLKLVGESDAIYEHLSEADRADGHLTEAADDLRHAIDLNSTVSAYRLELSQVYRALGQPRQAFDSAQEASRLEPNNPKMLDELIEASILAGKKQFAEDALKKLADVNPENKKIEDWRHQIEALDTSAMVHGTLDSDSPSLYETHTSPNDRS